MEIFGFKNLAGYKKVVKCFYYSFEKFFLCESNKIFSARNSRETETNTAVGYNNVFTEFGFQILQSDLRNEIYIQSPDAFN